MAKDAGFGEPQFVERESSQAVAGTVIAQSPQAGATVDRDTTIRLTLAVAAAAAATPPPTTEPTDRTAYHETAGYAHTDTDQDQEDSL